MYSSIAILALALLASANAASVVPQMVTNVDLFRSAVGLKADFSPKEVGGIITCGAAGRIVDVRFTGCASVPCQVLVGNLYEVAVDFHPSAAYPSLILEIIVIYDEQNIEIINTEVPESAVEPDRQYTLAYSLRVLDSFLGRSTLAFRLYGGSTSEICFIVAMNTSSP